jgi:hypothetical protein
VASEPPPYPGDRAAPADLLRLADAYRAAALALRDHGPRGTPADWAPFRLNAIHALELYLNAAIRADGCTPAAVRALQHDLIARLDHAAVRRLALRRRTTEHLHVLGNGRDYLLARYDPASATAPPSRMEATLADVARKARAAVAPAPPPPP